MLSLEKKRLDTELLVLVQLVFNQSSSSLSTHTYFCLESKNCPSSNRELIQDKPKIRCWSSFLGYPQVVTHVYVHGAEGLQNQDSTGGEGRRKARLYPRSANVAACSWTRLTALWKSFGCRVTGADPYVIIRCEGGSVRSTVRKDTLQPEFKTSGVFYRKKPGKPITVEVKPNTGWLQSLHSAPM